MWLQSFLFAAYQDIQANKGYVITVMYVITDARYVSDFNWSHKPLPAGAIEKG
jgi:hypothetical protein